MKNNIAENTLFPAEDESARASGEAEKNIRCFAQQLRALGQALEKFSFSAFDLELKSGNFRVKGRATSTENVKFSFLRFVRELMRGSTSRPTFTYAPNQVDLCFSPEEVEKFDVRGRIKRKDADQMPDPYSISQILRGAGSYLDNREVTNLVGISLSGKWVTVKYETGEGRIEQAKQDLEYFYDYWVKMYLRRSNRPKLPAPSDPTLFVSWEGMRRAHSFSNVRS